MIFKTRQEAIAYVGQLNGHPALVDSDHTTFCAMLEGHELIKHIIHLEGLIEAYEEADTDRYFDAMNCEGVFAGEDA
jgi:hypothetical protein